MNKNHKMISELIEITSRLISFPTVSPDGNEYLCKEFIIDLFRKARLGVSIKAKIPKRCNILGEYGTSKKSLLIACHLDTVPGGDGWKTNPFKSVVKNGKIYGRGSIDDKGPMAVAYCAVKQFIKDHPTFNGKIILAAVADEEADNEYGIKFLLKNGLKAQSALIPDGGYLNSFDYGEKGCIQLKIESFGKQEHSAIQENGNNAIENLINLLCQIKKELKFDSYDKRFSRLNVNFSLINGGDIPNTIPAKAWVQMDIRYTGGVSNLNIYKKINLIINSSKGKFRVSTKYETFPHIVEDKFLINAFEQASRRSGITMKRITLAGNSIAKELTQAGIPSIAHYPMNKITAHEPNEYIQITSMAQTQKLYYNFLKIYFNVKNEMGTTLQ